MSAEPLAPAVSPIKPESAKHRKYVTRPKSEDPEDLGFEKQRMVDWLAPGQLAQTGIKAVLSGIFGAYADKRETMAALNRRPDPHLYDHKEEIWIDYVADLGDGFNATYTMASLLAKDRLQVGGHETRRGDILVLGGDQVYPTASFEEYRNRMLKPYEAAFPAVAEGDPPHLYAIPGNHDWYDGLSNFTRIFCQEGWIGAWKAQQRRSYFALKLPHNWWLWAIDIQLEGFIDKSQLDYFDHQATHQLRPEDRIILCTAEPSWVYGMTTGPEAFRTLSFFEDRVIRERGKSRVHVALTGDLHHYTRYESKDPATGEETQRITAGGGGAYLYATHQMPPTLELNEGKIQKGDQLEDRKVNYELKATFPSHKESLVQSFGALALPFLSWRFGIFLAAPLYTLFAWILQSSSRLQGDGTPILTQFQSLTSLKDVLSTAVRTAVFSPPTLVFVLLLLGGLVAFCAAKRSWVRVSVGIAHGLAHLLLTILLMWGFARLNHRFAPDLGFIGTVFLFIAEMFAVGFLLGGALMAVYLLLCSFLGKFHTNEVFSSQRLQGYKNFLRLHIDRTGKLTIYPVGVRKICKDWEFHKEGRQNDPWWTPKEPIQVELIEKEPIPIP